VAWRLQALVNHSFCRAAGYVDRILMSEKPGGDLPVQAPTKYELVINLKTAKTSLLARADEVIE
jgi:putative ABC transport system substrate-binding protein